MAFSDQKVHWATTMATMGKELKMTQIYCNCYFKIPVESFDFVLIFVAIFIFLTISRIFYNSAICQ